MFNNLFDRKPDPANAKWLILIVEDNPVDRKFLVEALTRRGYKLIQATNGQEGLAMAKANKPDIVVMDCDMPVMNGMEMCRKMREDIVLERTPVIFLTGNETPQNILDCFELDAENYLSKPISAKILISQIQSALTEHSSAS